MPLKLTQRKNKHGEKAGNFWVRGTVAGAEIFESTGTTVKKDADLYRIARENELVKSKENIDRPIFAEALALYEENGGETTYNEKLVVALGHKFLDEIDQSLLERVSKELYPTQSNASVKRWFWDPVVAIMRFSARRGMCNLVLFEKPKVRRPAPKWAEMEWFEAFWPYCNDQLKAITTFLPYTGCRVTEALNLTWERINWQQNEAYIPETKTGVPRTVNLPLDVISSLKVIKPAKASGKVFPWASKDAVNWAIRRAVNRANKERLKKDLKQIEYMSSHKIGSHTYATWMRRYNGMDAAGLVATGRWKSPSSTFIYAHTSATEESKKSDNLPRAKSVQRAYKPRKSKVVSTFGT